MAVDMDFTPKEVSLPVKARHRTLELRIFTPSSGLYSCSVTREILYLDTGGKPVPAPVGAPTSSSFNFDITPDLIAANASLPGLMSAISAFIDAQDLLVNPKT